MDTSRRKRRGVGSAASICGDDQFSCKQHAQKNTTMPILGIRYSGDRYWKKKRFPRLSKHSMTEVTPATCRGNAIATATAATNRRSADLHAGDHGRLALTMKGTTCSSK